MNAAAGLALLSGPYLEHLVGFAALAALVALLAALVVASLRRRRR